MGTENSVSFFKLGVGMGCVCEINLHMQMAPKRGAGKGEGPIKAESTAVSQCLSNLFVWVEECRVIII